VIEPTAGVPLRPTRPGYSMASARRKLGGRPALDRHARRRHLARRAARRPGLRDRAFETGCPAAESTRSNGLWSRSRRRRRSSSSTRSTRSSSSSAIGPAARVPVDRGDDLGRRPGALSGSRSCSRSSPPTSAQDRGRGIAFVRKDWGNGARRDRAPDRAPPREGRRPRRARRRVRRARAAGFGNELFVGVRDPRVRSRDRRGLAGSTPSTCGQDAAGPGRGQAPALTRARALPRAVPRHGGVRDPLRRARGRRRIVSTASCCAASALSSCSRSASASIAVRRARRRELRSIRSPSASSASSARRPRPPAPAAVPCLLVRSRSSTACSSRGRSRGSVPRRRELRADHSCATFSSAGSPGSGFTWSGGRQEVDGVRCCPRSRRSPDRRSARHPRRAAASRIVGEAVASASAVGDHDPGGRRRDRR